MNSGAEPTRDFPLWLLAAVLTALLVIVSLAVLYLESLDLFWALLQRAFAPQVLIGALALVAASLVVWLSRVARAARARQQPAQARLPAQSVMEMASASRVSSKTDQAADKETALDLLAREACESLRATRCLVLLPPEDGAQLEIRAAWGDQMSDGLSQRDIETARRVAESREAVIWSRSAPLARGMRPRSSARLNLRPANSTLYTPLQTAGTDAGVLIAVRSRSGHPFTVMHLERARLFAERATAAMERAALKDRIDRYARDLQTLNEVTRNLIVTPTSDRIVDIGLRSLRDLLRYDVAAIFLVRERQLVIRAAEPTGEGLVLLIKDRIAEALRTVAPTAATETVADSSVLVLDDTPTVGEMVEGDLESFLTSPMVIGEEVIGIVHVGSSAPDAFSQEDLRTLSIVSSQVTIALRNAELYSQQLRDNQRLREIQATLETTVERLSQEEHRFTGLFDCSLDAIMVIDQGCVIQDFNPALEAITDWRADEVVGKARCQDVISCRSESGAPLCEDGCPFEGSSEVSPHAEFEIMARDGRKVLISATCFEIPATEGG